MLISYIFFVCFMHAYVDEWFIIYVCFNDICCMYFRSLYLNLMSLCYFLLLLINIEFKFNNTFLNFVFFLLVLLLEILIRSKIYKSYLLLFIYFLFIQIFVSYYYISFKCLCKTTIFHYMFFILSKAHSILFIIY